MMVAAIIIKSILLAIYAIKARLHVLKAILKKSIGSCMHASFNTIADSLVPLYDSAVDTETDVASSFG